MEKRTKILVALPLLMTGAAAGYHLYTLWQQRRNKKSRQEADEREKILGLSQIVLVENEQDWENISDQVLKDIQEIKVIGFDCEWVICKNVALIQIATQSGLCVLVRINKMKTAPEGLKKILSDKGILKVGVACFDDGKKLRNDHSLCVRGCVDLRHLVARSRTYNPWSYGLSGLSYCILNVTLDKNPQIRCGNWEAEELSSEQMRYAATDALVGQRLFMTMVNDKLDKTAGRNRQHSRKNMWQTALSLVQGIVDVNYSRKGYGASKKGQIGEASTSGASEGTSGKSRGNKGNGKKSKDDLTRAYNLRSKPLYQNCQLRAPDGQLLSTCDEKKALWYIEKGLAEKMWDEPLTVRLLFEPSGRPDEEANYYMQDKENICVVCGKEDSYIKKNVVPRDYRKNFPPLLKDHKSHDVVLLCTHCHQQSGVQDSILRDDLALKCDAPLNQQNVKYTKDVNLDKVRSAAKALLSCDKLPEERRMQLERVVMDYYCMTTITQVVLEAAAKIDPKVPNSEFLPHGPKVVQYFMQHEGLLTLERIWREHFVRTMKPNHLPSLWSVDHSHQRLRHIDIDMKMAINT